MIKHAINVFNVSTRVEEFDMTIDELLVYLPQLSARKEKLSLMRNRLPKSRVKDNYSKTIVEYEYVNYDLQEVRKDYEAVSDELNRAQLTLDSLNNSIEFDIDL